MNRFRTLVAVTLRGLLGAFVLWQVVYLFASLLFNLEEALGVHSPHSPQMTGEMTRGKKLGHDGLNDRGDTDCLVHTRADIADAKFQRGVSMMWPDVPPYLRAVGNAARSHE